MGMNLSHRGSEASRGLEVGRGPGLVSHSAASLALYPMSPLVVDRADPTFDP